MGIYRKLLMTLLLSSFLLTIPLTISTYSRFSTSSLGRIPHAPSTIQYVYGDRIFDENGKEVIWRGAGGSYLFHTVDYMAAWELHLREIEQMRLNTVRLAFSFPDSAPNPEYGTPSADILDYAKLDEILAFLDQYNIKAILDCHNYKDMYGDFGSQKLIDDWVDLAKRYRGDSRIVAYELFNEPFSSTWAPWLKTKLDVVKVYVDLTKQVREVDPEHIIIWQSGSYLPPFDDITGYLQPNVVYTVHRWYRQALGWDEKKFDIWTSEQISFLTIGYLVELREKFNVPVWLGEFGSNNPMDESNPEWLLTEQLLFRAEEQVIGWNLWMGRTGKNIQWDAYLPFFPLKVYSEKLVRKRFYLPVPKLTDYVIKHQGVDRLEPYTISMWHNNDSITFGPGIVILVETNRKLDGTIQIVSEERISVIEELTIRNEEGTANCIGDWNTNIYPLEYIQARSGG